MGKRGDPILQTFHLFIFFFSSFFLAFSSFLLREVLGDRGEENLKRLRMASGANVQLLRGTGGHSCGCAPSHWVSLGIIGYVI